MREITIAFEPDEWNMMRNLRVSPSAEDIVAGRGPIHPSTKIKPRFLQDRD